MHAHFAGDALVFYGAVGEQAELLRRREVQQVKAGIVTGSQLDGARRGGIAGFGAAYQGVIGYGQLFPETLDIHFAVGADYLLAFAVYGNEGGRLGEDARQGVFVVDQHIAGGRAHKEFHAAHARVIGFFQHVGIVGGRTYIKRIVGKRGLRRAGEFPFQRIERSRGRLRVGHVHE